MGNFIPNIYCIQGPPLDILKHDWYRAITEKQQAHKSVSITIINEDIDLIISPIIDVVELSNRKLKFSLHTNNYTLSTIILSYCYSPYIQIQEIQGPPLDWLAGLIGWTGDLTFPVHWIGKLCGNTSNNKTNNNNSNKTKCEVPECSIENSVHKDSLNGFDFFIKRLDKWSIIKFLRFITCLNIATFCFRKSFGVFVVASECH